MGIQLGLYCRSITRARLGETLYRSTLQLWNHLVFLFQESDFWFLAQALLIFLQQ